MELSPYDIHINAEMIKEYIDVPNELKIKFTNPIRDYSHLMTNRLIHQLINITSIVN